MGLIVLGQLESLSLQLQDSGKVGHDAFAVIRLLRRDRRVSIRLLKARKGLA